MPDCRTSSAALGESRLAYSEQEEQISDAAEGTVVRVVNVRNVAKAFFAGRLGKKDQMMVDQDARMAGWEAGSVGDGLGMVQHSGVHALDPGL